MRVNWRMRARGACDGEGDVVSRGRRGEAGCGLVGVAGRCGMMDA